MPDVPLPVWTSITKLGPSRHQTDVVHRDDVDGAPAKDGAAALPRVVPKAVRVERAEAEPLVLTLYPDRVYVFGRAPEATLVFPPDSVSRLHGQLRFTGEGWRYRDLNSSNGSFIVTQPTTDGDDPRRAAKALRGGDEHEVLAGQTLLLGNRHSRLVFLSDAPPQVGDAAGSGEASAAAKALDRAVSVSARHRMPVFLLGPSGSGKTYVARAIHDRARMEGQFVLLNCGRLPTDAAALTSELLGHVKGAFTGAASERKGKFAAADQGTLFLDEVESLPKVAQDFLLDVLEGSGGFAPYGASSDERVAAPRFRLVSASKAPLRASGLRADLCQRLAAGEVVTLPTLAERRDDIPGLVEAFVAQLLAEQRIDAEISSEAMLVLQRAAWPGEIRELESTVKVVVSRAHAGQQIDGLEGSRLVIDAETVRGYLQQRQRGFEGDAVAVAKKRVGELTRDDVAAALQACGGNKTKAAATLGIALNTLKAKLKAP